MDRIDGVVVGAGVVGLAVARALALRGLEIIVVEREHAIGTGVSSRNSEVIHAGLYYAPGSLKARLCVHGRQLLYRYCAERGIAHRRCGKLVVATRADDQAKLCALQANAAACDVLDLRLLSAHEAQAVEPALRCTGALWSPSSGIVDSHALMLSLQADAERDGAVVALASPFVSARPDAAGWIVRTGGAQPFELRADRLVNCAGLGAQEVARGIEGLAAQTIPKRRLAKGHYFALAGRSPFSRLVYPVPVDGGLGVHLTLDLAGQARFGPDVEWLPDADETTEPDYAVDEARGAGFVDEIRRYWPALPDAALVPAYSGVRPKIAGPGQSADFRIDGPAVHGLPRLVNLFGIESPGLTSCLAIADAVARLIEQDDPAT